MDTESVHLSMQQRQTPDSIKEIQELNIDDEMSSLMDTNPQHDNMTPTTSPKVSNGKIFDALSQSNKTGDFGSVRNDISMKNQARINQMFISKTPKL